jgi:hypothetical protein
MSLNHGSLTPAAGVITNNPIWTTTAPTKFVDYELQITDELVKAFEQFVWGLDAAGRERVAEYLASRFQTNELTIGWEESGDDES